MRTGLAIKVCLFFVALLVAFGGLLLGCKTAPTPSPSPVASPSPKPSPSPTPSPKPTTTPTPTGPPYFQGKTITIVVIASAGGPVDSFARVMAGWLPKYIPGNPSIIVTNMPGANGNIAANYVYNVAKPDGLTIMASGGSTMTSNLLRPKGTDFDLKNMSIILGNQGFGGVEFIKTGVIDKFDDIYEKEVIIFGTSPPPSSPSLYFLLERELLGFKVSKLLLAYGGSGEWKLAFMKGEINMSQCVIGAYESFVKGWIENKEVQPLWQSGMLDTKGQLVRYAPTWGDIPTMEERHVEKYGKSPSGKVWKAYKAVVATSTGVNQGLWLRPGTPSEVVKILADASDKMKNDANFAAEAKKKLGITVETGEPLRALFTGATTFDPEGVQWLRDWLRTNYGVE